MAIIAPTFDRDARDLDKARARARHAAGMKVYTPAEIRAEFVAYRLAHQQIVNRFEQALATEFAVDLPTAIQARIFRLAWEDGSGQGFAEVEYQYEELARLALEVWNLARQN